MITPSDLNAYLGKNISAICNNGFVAPNDNHCAHFVSHAMNYRFGYNCQLAGHGKSPGMNIRVHEVFAKCPSVGAWADRPATLSPCLVFVTGASNVNVAKKVMENIPKKHIGIFIGGTIWHYSNSHHKVVTQTPEEFIKHYPTVQDSALFFGALIP